MTRAYELTRLETAHHPSASTQGSDSVVVIVAAVLVLGVWLGTWWALLGVPVALLRRGSAPTVALCVAVAMLGSWLGTQAWQAAHPRHLGEYSGWAELVSDPAPFGVGLRVTVEIEGERFDAWLYGGQRRKMIDAQAGEYVWLQGHRSELTSGARRAAVRHVVGRFTPTVMADVVDGSALNRASNRVRRSLRTVAESTMGDDDAALFAGLVIGDDARQRVEVIETFRGAGLSHLTAVSGQNVAFVLAAALPLLRRLRPWWRWAATVAVVAWFMALTRFEPSVLRAGVMAMLAATAYVRGAQASPVRLLSLAVTALVVVDPLLVWSVAFWLSVGATAGVCVLGPWFRSRLPGPRWVRLPLSITIGAQLGVALPSLMVFHRLPVVSLPANLLAVPVAGFVMLYGLPAGIVAAWLPNALKALVMLPAEWGTHWVALVARVGYAVEPAPLWSAACWLFGLVTWLFWRFLTQRGACANLKSP
ncbi:MAG: ComEC/Rec2 family competence protein [Ilumatobacteraceae bacterium]